MVSKQVKRLIMTTIKIISFIFICTFFCFGVCSTSSTLSNKSISDTTYIISTKQLKSDKIPDSIFKMTNLHTLIISGMDCDYGNHTNCWMVKEIPKEIKNLKKLITLRFTQNAIQEIPNELSELKELKLIDLTDNVGLSSVVNITKIKSLESLLLYGCNLTKLPDNIGELKNLKELGLTGNNFDKKEQEKIKKALSNCTIKF
jgi:Leucine-rich repeat (LRR) protein